jgi:hypothetical protein
VHFDPMVVTALAAHKIVGVAAGAFHSLAVTDMGLVFAWGDNSHGQARLPAVRSFAACASACGVTVCRRCSRRRRAHRRATADDGVSLLLRWSEHSVEQNRRGTARARQRVLQSTGNGAKVSSTSSAAVGNVCLSILMPAVSAAPFLCLLRLGSTITSRRCCCRHVSTCRRTLRSGRSHTVPLRIKDHRSE